jgi:hypothetical protein
MVPVVLRPSTLERATRSSFCLYDERGSTKNQMVEMKEISQHLLENVLVQISTWMRASCSASSVAFWASVSAASFVCYAFSCWKAFNSSSIAGCAT